MNIMDAIEIKAAQKIQKNLQFFKYHHHDIYERFSCYTPSQNLYDLKLDDDSFKKIIIEKYYGSNSEELIELEVNKFIKKDKKININVPIPPPEIEKNLGMRNFSILKNKLLDNDVFSNKKLQENDMMCNFIPNIVFIGIGLGLHIEKLLKIKAVHAVTIFELDPDRFYYSLLLVDWEELITPFNHSNEKKLSLIIADGNIKNREIHSRLLYLHFLSLSPSFPVLTHFYRHNIVNQSAVHQSYYDELLQECYDNCSMSLATWGNYDDEMIQINQAMHNIKNKCSIIDVKMLKKQECDGQPVFLVGAGPSLDSNIEILKKIKDRYLIISCGSAITALHGYGLVPDYHVESESDYAITYGYLNSLQDADYLKSIRLLAPLQMNPLVVNLFGQSLLFPKEGCTSSDLFFDKAYTLNHTAPTCLNSAFGLVVGIGYSEVVLCGTDLGFYDVNNHHSSASIYYNKDASECFKAAVDYDKKGLIKLQGYKGKPIYTNAFYYTTKKKLEVGIKAVSEFVTSYNISHGAIIEGSHHLGTSADIDNQFLSNTRDSLKDSKIDLFMHAGQLIDSDNIHNTYHKSAKDLVGQLKLVSVDFNVLLSKHERHLTTFERIHTLVLTIQSYLESVVRPQSSGIYSLIRGSCWQFCFILIYFNFFGLYSLENQKKFNKLWCDTVKQFIDGLSVHCHAVLDRQLSIEKDIWLTQSISDNEKI